MSSFLKIRPLERRDISCVTHWSRIEGFAPGIGDVGIYRHTDRQGLWVGWLGNKPIGCIAGIRYNASYGFIGLFIVTSEYRGNGYGCELWKHALNHLENLPCIGLEAAPSRITDYSKWGFKASSDTTRWQLIHSDKLLKDNLLFNNQFEQLHLLEGHNIPSNSIQAYDAKREPSPRPHFLSDWLNHSAGKVLALVDRDNNCHGFGRIRPCLLKEGEGWRIGPLIADSDELAELLIRNLTERHPGIILLDSPGLNPGANDLCERLGFNKSSQTLRMYKGTQPTIQMKDVYGLACLELG